MGRPRFKGHQKENALKIELSAYDPAWPATFRRVEARIRAALGSAALVVEHVGSTAVPGLWAKPVIDVVLVVRDSSGEADYLPALEAAGFSFHVREPEWHEHRLLKLSGPPANIHVFSSGCPEVQRMVAFRDLLRTDWEARVMYESKKRELATGDWMRVQDYADAKSTVVEALLAQAGNR